MRLKRKYVLSSKLESPSWQKPRVCKTCLLLDAREAYRDSFVGGERGGGGTGDL